MSSHQNQASSTNLQGRPRPGAGHKHSKSSSSIVQVPKRHGNRNQNQRSTYNSNNNNQNTKPANDEFKLTHVSSDPTPLIAPITPPKGAATGRFMQPYASDGGNLSSNEKKGKKKRQPKRPKDLNTAAAAQAVISEAEPSLPPVPHTAKPFATPGKHYAGPTFHHSPAPSALPLPSFFSRSVPSTPNGPSLSTMMSSESEDSDSSPSSDAKNDESPLAKLFRADSEERAAGLRPHRRSRKDSLLDDNPFKSRSTGNLPGHGIYGDATGADIFAMDSVKSTQPSETKPTDGTEGEAARKRKEKASALKEILLQHAPVSPEPLWHGIPLPLSPSPRARRQENFRNKTPVKQHHHNNNYAAGSPSPSAKGNHVIRPAEQFHNAAIPKKQASRGNSHDNVPSKDPKAIEDYLRWALKIDTASATGVRG